MINEATIKQENEVNDSWSINHPILYIGLGGTGTKAINSTKKLIKDKFGYIPTGIAFLAIDADQNEINENDILDPNDEFIKATVSNPKSWYKNNESFAKTFYFQKKWPRSAIFGASEYRQVGRMCYFNNFKKIRSTLISKLNKINPMGATNKNITIEVFIITSVCGGAGNGMFIDIASLLHDYREKNNANIFNIGLFVTGDVYLKFPEIVSEEIRAEKIFLANTYAALKELQFFQNVNETHIKDPNLSFKIHYPNDNESIEIDSVLFDLPLIIQSVNRYGKITIQSQQQLNEFLANTLFLLSISPFQQNKQANWVNPISGFAQLEKSYNGLPTSFSSLGYFKLIYPETELINYIKTKLSREILKIIFNISNGFKDKKIKDIIERLAISNVEDKGKYDNKYLLNILKKYINFKAVDIKRGLEEIANKEDWENLKNKIDEFINFYLDELSIKGRLTKQILEQQKEFNKNFRNYLDSLKEEFIEKKISLFYLENFLVELKNSFISEKSDAEYELEKINFKNSLQDFEESKKLCFELIEDKPLFFKRKKLNDKVEDLTDKFYQYLLNSYFKESYNNIIKFYENSIFEIQNRINKVTAINTKIQQIYHELNKKEEKFWKKLLKLFDQEKNYLSSFMNFSILQKEDVENEIKKVKIKKDKIYKFIEDYWNFDIKENNEIIEMLEEKIKDILKTYEMSLEDALYYFEVDKERFIERINFFKENVKAQWNIDDNIMIDTFSIEKKIAYPKNFQYITPETENVSSSDKAIEIFSIEYALPLIALRSIKSWRNYYNKRLDEVNNSLHIFPEANKWLDLDVYPSYEEDTLLFALGLAFGEIYELTEEEKKALREKYGNNNYKNFIFKKGNWYILMPFYPLKNNKVNKVEMATNSDITTGKKGFRIQGLSNAYKTFLSNEKYKKEIEKWLKDRIYGKDVKKIYENIQYYLNEKISPMINNQSNTELIEKIKNVLIKYLKWIEENNYTSIEIDDM